MLRHLRVLDMCDDRGLFAGALLAQLGAEVVLVEPPGGRAFRQKSPLVGEGEGAASVPHLAFNRGKKSIVLDWTTLAGAARLAELLAGADVLLTTGGPAEHAVLGIPSPHDLQSAHPHLVVANVSGFGLSGPKADWLDSDLLCGASGVTTALTGDRDRAPLRTSVPQVFHNAAADAVVGVLIALADRARSGRGQLIDASAQESWIWASGYTSYSAQWGVEELRRNGGSPSSGRLHVRFIYPASDGLVTITVLLGAAIGPYTQRLVAWMGETGDVSQELLDTDWTTFKANKEPERLDRLNDAVASFTGRLTQAELVAGAQERRLLIAPVLTLEDILQSEHFRVRGSFCETLVGGRTVALPGSFVRTDPPLPELAPAPALGEHADELEQRDGTVRRASEDEGAALTGLKVLDLTTSFAGPLVGRTLAAFGAQVVKVESERRPDTARASAPFRGKGFECSLANAHTNAGKQSLALDLTTDEGKGVLADLLVWADVLVESSTPGALGRLGFDDARLLALNPGLVVLHSSMMGQSGPLARFPGYGNMATALSGFFYTTGWADREPVGPAGAYTDWLSPRFGLIAVLAALEGKRQTGKGAQFDLGQGEAALQLLSTALADVQLNGGNWSRVGNVDQSMAPHGIFPCAGDDRWIAVVCRTEGDWQRLAALMDRPDLADVPFQERVARAAELEKVISEFTAEQDDDDLQHHLQAAGVPAHRVQNSADCATDVQLAARGGLVVEAVHDVLGPVPVGLPPMKLSRSTPLIATAAPTLGQHTYEVLTEVLGYSDEQFAELAVADALR